MSKIYAVVKGDSLSKIARAHGVALGELLKANPQFTSSGRNPNLIDLGEKVTIPDKSNFYKNNSLKTGTAKCLTQRKNWIELEYLYCDGTGVAGAHYYVVNDDGDGIVAQGILDNNGYAWRELPEPVNNVSYNFDKDPSTVQYLRQPTANPEQPKVKEGWFDRMADNIAAAGSWTWGTIQGDFNEDQTVGQVATNAVITMIPVVDQVGDVRDITANLKFLIWDKRYNDKWVWIALVLTLIGLIPVLGSAAKGILKTVAKALKTGGKVPLKLLIEVLNKFHKGNASSGFASFLLICQSTLPQ